MLSSILRQKFIDFFVTKHNHKEIPSASLIPENDPTVLFTTAGMHPLVPYLMGEKHPQGTKLVDVQKCMRTDDIDEVGDATHCTFFEMLGNWSLGDYFKKEAIQWSYEFLTTELNLNPDLLCVTCFAGDKDAPKDEEAAKIWESLGFVKAENIPENQKRRIYFLGKKDNWWGPAGKTGPCGPDTEMFYYTGSNKNNPYEKGGPDINKEWVEIWNNVFMQYNKKEDGTFEILKQQNVDTGMGLERVTAILQGKNSHYETELFQQKSTGKSLYIVLDEISNSANSSNESIKSKRIILDHLRSATFVIGDQRGVVSSNTDQGYIVRKLIRRAIRHGKKIGIQNYFCSNLAKEFIEIYSDVYPELSKNQQKILNEMQKEEEKFSKTLETGLKEFEKFLDHLKVNNQNQLSGKDAFLLYQSYGFPFEMTKELCKENQIEVDENAFNQELKTHQELSRLGAEQKFSGGLADHSEETTKLHTATHLLHKALRIVLGDHVQQKGSNITVERLRFDFNHAEKMTSEQIKKVEEIVNEQIQKGLDVSFEELTVEEAKQRGAIGLFEDKYSKLGNKIKVYKIGDFSLEICGGPHVKNTSELKNFKIVKEESSAAGIRRIKAVVGD
ncbi:MAG: alanyl-tRNA synthetase, alanyl-tRNA synthetase [Candidatus Peregrinibacteria bacterium GW2011_GWF2_33_10]|nr:MAG: alanyl-tRNA synthetase, alanyl-tRNA synthetase [Candidatus Peregrinibacteria bacterium GW2011_GWF2_33_10]OGJ44042.1 MAG: alanine--tRNA ligase [Candidatus Peregrinibacteria bacterium RIFOXYA12_FULL_33_12]OGJ44172.1 MAG: alanine--tRNA ligase [Candidatus Peregrinibacteria bacterium RIFOXYA2_FULL_33_21]OGJ51801.1 MAG: alanine--tRNA ligase [Candidatus Peregrinibacteria bacterium RIFOXYB2_FULL_33_20]